MEAKRNRLIPLIALALAALFAVVLLARGAGDPRNVAREFLAAVDRGDYARAVKLQVYPARAQTVEAQRATWQAWQSSVKKIAAAGHEEYLPLAKARLEVTGQGKETAEVTAYWNDAIIRLTLRRAGRDWRVASVGLEPAPSLGRRLVLAVMSQHAAIPRWLDGLDRYWNSDVQWNINAAGWIDLSWTNAYTKVINDLMNHFETPLMIITGSTDLVRAATDPELDAQVRAFEEMVHQVREEVGLGMNGARPNLPWTRDHVPRAKETYWAWREKHAAGLPDLRPEDVNALLEAVPSLLRQAGKWPGWLDPEQTFGKARW